MQAFKCRKFIRHSAIRTYVIPALNMETISEYVISLSLSRLAVRLFIYSCDVTDPGVELVGIVSPLDEVFGIFPSSPRLYHSFDDIRIVRFVPDGLNFLLVKFPFSFLPCQIFQNIRWRIRRIERGDSEYFLGPRRLVALLEYSLRLLQTNGLSNIISPLERYVLKRIQSLSNERFVLSVNFGRSHFYTTMIRVVIGRDELR